MVEKIVETDEELTGRYLNGENIEVAELRSALRKATISGAITPVMCGTALRNKGCSACFGCHRLLFAVSNEVPPIEGIHPDTNEPEFRPPSDEAPFAALVFKIVTDPYVGKLAYFRVYSGKIEAGGSAINGNKRKERFGRIVRMNADSREDLDAVYAGDIAAVLGLKNTFTGDTLCNRNYPILLESIDFPEPVISLAIEPKTNLDQDKMGIALRALAEEDPTFQVRFDDQTGQTVLYGMGELHLDVLVDRMLREFRLLPMSASHVLPIAKLSRAKSIGLI